MNPETAPPTKLGFIGAGKMAQAIAGGFTRAFPDSLPDIFYHDPSMAAATAFQQEVHHAQRCQTNDEVCESASTLVLAVKPQVLKEVCLELAGACQHALVISIAAGIPIHPLQEWLSSDRVIRVMPNTPCLVGEGVSGFAAGSGASLQDREICNTLFSSLGVCVEVNEQQLDAVTGLSGSGPAYVFSMIEGLSDGGVLAGLTREIATKLAIQTLLGSAKLAAESPHHPAVLREQVTSPGGTTARGLQALEDHAFRAALISAVSASAERARELGRSVN
jgi:pyrroline-5-carboxylate reductase